MTCKTIAIFLGNIWNSVDPYVYDHRALFHPTVFFFGGGSILTAPSFTQPFFCLSITTAPFFTQIFNPFFFLISLPRLLLPHSSSTPLCVCSCMCECAQGRGGEGNLLSWYNSWLTSCAHKYICTCVCMRMCVRVCVCAYVCACLCACVRASVRAYGCACVRACVIARVRACVRAGESARAYSRQSNRRIYIECVIFIMDI